MTPAERRKQRTYRLRRKHGLAVLPITVDEYSLANKLIEDGILTTAEALNRSNVAVAVGQLVADYVGDGG